VNIFYKKNKNIQVAGYQLQINYSLLISNSKMLLIDYQD